MSAPDKIYIDHGPNGGWMHRHERMPDTVAEYTRTDLIPNTAYVAGLEAALFPETRHGQRKDHSRIGHCLAEGSWHVHLAGFCCEGDAERFLAVALSARPDAHDTRVVTVDQLERWERYFDESTATRQMFEIRAIIGEVK